MIDNLGKPYPMYQPEAADSHRFESMQLPGHLSGSVQDCVSASSHVNTTWSVYISFKSIFSTTGADMQGWKTIKRHWINLNFETSQSPVCCPLIPWTHPSLLISDWEATQELLGYWGAAVFIRGQSVAYTVHLPSLATSLLTFPRLWLQTDTCLS